MTKFLLLFAGVFASLSVWGAGISTAGGNADIHIAPYRAPVPAVASALKVIPPQPVNPADSIVESALTVKPVLANGTSPSAEPATPALSVSARDGTLRAALERWLVARHWQLAWDVDSDLPLEFDAQFAGDFDGVLRQAMQATNHMRQPTRACVHPNAVVRVIARAANCTE